MTTIESADCGHARSSINLQHNLDTTQYVFGFVERTTCWYNGFAYDYDDPSQILESATCSNFYEGCSQRESIAWFSLLNPASKAVAGRYPAKAMDYPGATPGAKILKISKILGKCLRHSLRRSLRVNKNLHIPSGYAHGILLHNICP
ncbi:hypothetical protein T4C_12452 [Trichinella pseudospiralis]|uniref:Uncharacterized protein n=1 Tax=Trichinella pseudospiralis TaxID=6337 RepID=A0A0V1JWD1_TRIPS|nr:hypothetical protein T4C_12452 [Trichinella pseudospiralis]